MEYWDKPPEYGTPEYEEWILFWARVGHTDAWHPGSRESCSSCQEMIGEYGPMPNPLEIRAAAARLFRKVEKKTPIPEELRWQVWERDTFTCQICGRRNFLRVDHIIPESKGGPMTLENLQTLCQWCNSRKGTR